MVEKKKKITLGTGIAAVILTILLLLLLLACDVCVAWVFAKIFGWIAANIMHVALPINFRQFWFIIFFVLELRPRTNNGTSEQLKKLLGRD
jgi:hypothetical protein